MEIYKEMNFGGKMVAMNMEDLLNKISIANKNAINNPNISVMALDNIIRIVFLNIYKGNQYEKYGKSNRELMDNYFKNTKYYYINRKKRDEWIKNISDINENTFLNFNADSNTYNCYKNCVINILKDIRGIEKLVTQLNTPVEQQESTKLKRNYNLYDFVEGMKNKETAPYFLQKGFASLLNYIGNDKDEYNQYLVNYAYHSRADINVFLHSYLIPKKFNNNCTDDISKIARFIKDWRDNKVEDYKLKFALESFDRLYQWTLKNTNLKNDLMIEEPVLLDSNNINYCEMRQGINYPQKQTYFQNTASHQKITRGYSIGELLGDKISTILIQPEINENTKQTITTIHSDLISLNLIDIEEEKVAALPIKKVDEEVVLSSLNNNIEPIEDTYPNNSVIMN